VRAASSATRPTAVLDDPLNVAARFTVDGAKVAAKLREPFDLDAVLPVRHGLTA
jgi:hypothetical protein